MHKFFFILLLMISPFLHAKDAICYLTAAKADCWKDYKVTIFIIESEKRQHIASLMIPQDKLWGRMSFPCKLGVNFTYEAEYAPAIWQNDKEKRFKYNKILQIKPDMPEDSAALSLDVCFPKDFLNTPVPMSRSKACRCNLEDIPPVKMKESP